MAPAVKNTALLGLPFSVANIHNPLVKSTWPNFVLSLSLSHTHTHTLSLSLARYLRYTHHGQSVTTGNTVRRITNSIIFLFATQQINKNILKIRQAYHIVNWLKVGSTKVNGREPNSWLGQVFNSKLDHFDKPHSKFIARVQPHL